MDSGIIFGRMSNQDFNSMLKRDGFKETVDLDPYNAAREAYA